MKVRFETKDRGKDATLTVMLEYQEKSPPIQLFEAFKNTGWDLDSMVPGYAGKKEVWFHKPGTGVFAGWTPEEAKLYRKEARTILRKFGFVNIPVRRLTLEDCV